MFNVHEKIQGKQSQKKKKFRGKSKKLRTKKNVIVEVQWMFQWSKNLGIIQQLRAQ
jgi:predicted nucleic-acid-binding protein